MDQRLYSGDIPYISGGNSPYEYDRMEAARRQYNLRLLFSTDNADYVPNSVRVRVQDMASQRTLLDTDMPRDPSSMPRYHKAGIW